MEQNILYLPGHANCSLSTQTCNHDMQTVLCSLRLAIMICKLFSVHSDLQSWYANCSLFTQTCNHGMQTVLCSIRLAIMICKLSSDHSDLQQWYINCFLMYHLELQPWYSNCSLATQACNDDMQTVIWPLRLATIICILVSVLADL